jgi:hypothetical protein
MQKKHFFYRTRIQMDGRYELLLKAHDELTQERDMYMAVCGTRGDALREKEDENEALKEENARLKSTATTANADLVKRLKAKYAESVKKREDLQKANSNMQDLNVDMSKKVRALTAKVSEFKPTLKAMEDLQQEKRELESRLGGVFKDLKGMAKIADKRQAEINRLKRDGAGEDVARDMRILSEKIATQVRVGVFLLRFSRVTRRAGGGDQVPEGHRAHEERARLCRHRAARRFPRGAVLDARRVPGRDREGAGDRDPGRGRRARLRGRGARERRRPQARALGDRQLRRRAVLAQEAEGAAERWRC